MRFLLWLGLALVVAWGCGGDDDSGGAPDAGDRDADLIDTGMPVVDGGLDAGPVVDGGVDAADPTLPPCNLVCDRVLDCAGATCMGIDWRTARLAQDYCDDACGAQLNMAVMAATDCAGVMAVVATAAPALGSLCNDAPCVTACQQFALCTKQECERYASQTTEEVAQGCMGWCEDDSAGDILNVTCETLITALDTDPSFAAGCHGSSGCADMTACAAYADKTTACMLGNCDGNADAYAMGIRQVLIDYCATADDCPAPESIALINDASVTCDDPPLNASGPAAPFTLICAGTVGAEYADLLAACDTLITCGAAFADNHLCATYLAFEAGASTKAMCIDMAADCTGAFGCL